MNLLKSYTYIEKINSYILFPSHPYTCMDIILIHPLNIYHLLSVYFSAKRLYFML